MWEKWREIGEQGERMELEREAARGEREKKKGGVVGGQK